MAAQIRPQTGLVTRRGERLTVTAWRGEGSYARVYRGALGLHQTPCALKLAKAEIDGAVPRLRAEEAVLRAVRHPRIVALLDAGEHGELPFLVLEWLEGETLLDLIARRRRLPLRQALELIEAVADGLSCLHARGLPHGDLRPENVIVVPNRGAVLTDPGVAAPAQAPGSSPAADVRALGNLLQRTLTGEDPEKSATRLTAGAGHNPAVVALCERIESSTPPTAAAVLSEVAAFRRRL